MYKKPIFVQGDNNDNNVILLQPGPQYLFHSNRNLQTIIHLSFQW